MFQRVKKIKMKISQRQTFPVVLQENINEYDLSYDLAEYANDYCKKIIPEQELKEYILFDHPVHSNIQEPNRLDRFLEDNIKDKS